MPLTYMPRDFYEVLGVGRSATQEEIKRAYRRLSKEFHPDKHKGDKGDKDVEQRYKEINEAYETLNDPKKRQMYDQFGSAGPGGGGFGGFSGFNQGDFSGFSDIFESFFGGRGPGGRQARDQRGSDMEVELVITLQDVVHGAQHTLSLRKQHTCSACGGSGAKEGAALVTCSTCSGTGQVTRSAQSFFGTIQQSVVCPACAGSGKMPETPCASCGGEGRREEKSTVTVDVPAGIDDGQTLRVRGEGEAGRQGAPAGDLFVHIRIKPDHRFEREREDIRSSITIPAIDAILGTEVPVETVHGPVTLKVPDATQPGQVFRLRGKGLPVLSSSRHGDHYVTVQVEIPKKLSRKEKELMGEWRKLGK
ncbi:MAG: molecular chaperone DnaJ [Candidatus Peribacteraceae bacterium]|nr:molecular chaperone DnaJ [Candidatus Peribacteraceae bacterium]